MIGTNTIALILRALATAAGMPGVFGAAAVKLAPLLNTLASFVELPEKTKPFQDQLLSLVRTWVAENRGPTDAELETLRATVDSLDAELRELQEKLANESAAPASPGEHL